MTDELWREEQDKKEKRAAAFHEARKAASVEAAEAKHDAAFVDYYEGGPA